MSTSNNSGNTQPGVLVIGARGALGSLVVDAFRRRGWSVYQAGRTPSASGDFRHVDLTVPSTVGPAVAGVDVVVTTVPDVNLVAERHVLRHGGVLLNLSAEPAAATETLRQEAGARGTVLMNAGIAPGVTNLVAAALLEEHPEADEIEFVFTVTAKGTGGRAAADFAHRGFTGRSRHRVTRVDLPEPFGARDVLGFAEPDGGWLGPVVDGRTVSPYICLAERSTDRLMRGLNRVGLIAKLPRAALGSGSRHGSAVDASREPVAHRVAVLRRGRCLDAGLIRGNGDFRMAAASSVVFADAVVGRDGGERAKPGVWYPEEAMSLRRIGPALRGAGITVSDNSSGDCCRSE